MGFKGRGDEDDLPAEGVGGHAPFHRFFDRRERGVHAFPDMFEDRPRERLRLIDIGVDARVLLDGSYDPVPQHQSYDTDHDDQQLRF